jgi:hypothetical protein
MVERAGCVCGKRGHGNRKFGGDLYQVYKTYVMRQDYGMDEEIFKQLKTENFKKMDADKTDLKKRGYKVRTFSEECGGIITLYYKNKVLP